MLRSDVLNNKTYTLLLVEDQLSDIRLTQEALRGMGALLQIKIVMDGEEALDYLMRRTNKYEHAPRPDLILLDINLPKIDGIELAGIIKKDSSLSVIPIVMLSTSESQNDILRAYQAGVNCYISKPLDFNDFLEIMNIVCLFWFKTITLPAI